MTDYGFMVSTGGVAQVIAAAAFAGAAGALLGAGIGAVIRNTGGAVTVAFLVLIMVPPLAVQLTSAARPWVPGELAAAVPGVGGDIGVTAALAALAAWGLVPAAIGVGAVRRRDVV